MCYYNGMRVSYAEFIRLKEMERELKHLNSLTRLRNGFDYSDWPIIKPAQNGQDFTVQDAHWEFIPAWIKNGQELAESRKKFSTLNATAEKLLESRMFRSAALSRRCLVLSSGFFEWRHYKPDNEKKEIAFPYYIDVPAHPVFFMAGIWQPWTDQDTGETFDTFAIVTTKANDLMQQVHNTKKRMPTILTEDLAWQWIQPGLSEEQIFSIASFQFDSEEMAAHSIARDFRQNFKTLQLDPIIEYDYPELPPLL